MDVLQRKRLEVSVDGSGGRHVKLKIGTEWEGIDVCSTIGDQEEMDRYFEKLNSLCHHRCIVKPLAWTSNIRGTHQSAIYYKKPICSLAELGGEKLELFVGMKGQTSDMSRVLKSIIFNTGAVVHSLHLRNIYHGDLKLQNIWIYEESDAIVPKLHGIKGLLNSENIIDLEERKKHDWYNIGYMIQQLFSRYGQSPCTSLRYYVGYLQRIMTVGSCLSQSYWCTYEEKKGRILRMHLQYDYTSAASIPLPEKLKNLLNDLDTDSSEANYTHDLASVVSMLRNKLFHPDTPSHPEFKNDFELLLNHVEDICPEIWTELEIHGKIWQPPQLTKPVQSSMHVQSLKHVPREHRITPNKQNVNLLSKKQQKKQNKTS